MKDSTLKTVGNLAHGLASYQQRRGKLTIFINQLEFKENINLNILNYFISEQKNNNLKQALIFKLNTVIELQNHLERIFKYIVDNSNEQLKDIIIGKIWQNIQFDWGEYK